MILVDQSALTPQLSKPRASGDDPITSGLGGAFKSVNPARAGMIRLVGGIASPEGGKPRASGDDPKTGRPEPVFTS